ncbi:MAG: methyl-accepting chemotaxis protein [Clostridia bacterium]|nr:methyl-accepting chemotaxis protein [Clostridia bacterium]
MKKISTKIIIMSLVNSLFVAAINVGASIFMNNSRADQSAANTAANAPMPSGGMQFLPPTPVLIGLAISLVFGVVLSYIIGKYISRPILKVTEITRKTSEFDLVDDQLLEEPLKYKDESGAMARALGDTRKALREMAVKLQNVTATVASHSDNLTQITDENVRTITQVVSTINEIAAGNSSQARMINDINTTLLEAVNLIDNITEEASKGAGNAVQSLDSITEGQNAVDIQARRMEENLAISYEANKSINELSKMIDQVAGIVNVITSIANQTNLLALNAAIEAARAGESGKGFAVVAEEIRNLAEESSKSAKKITEIINSTKEKAGLAVSSISKAGTLVDDQKEALKVTQEAFDKIKTTYKQIVNSFQHTAAAMKTINEKSKGIFVQTQDMAAIAQESAASTEEISAAGQEQLASIEMVAQSSRDLYLLAGELNAEINKFKVQ